MPDRYNTLPRQEAEQVCSRQVGEVSEVEKFCLSSVEVVLSAVSRTRKRKLGRERQREARRRQQESTCLPLSACLCHVPERTIVRGLPCCCSCPEPVTCFKYLKRTQLQTQHRTKQCPAKPKVLAAVVTHAGEPATPAAQLRSACQSTTRCRHCL